MGVPTRTDRLHPRMAVLLPVLIAAAVLTVLLARGHVLLEDIPGVGATRRRALLTHFKSVANIAAATPEALCEVEGIGKAQAKAIWDYYHPEEKESGGAKP